MWKSCRIMNLQTKFPREFPISTGGTNIMILLPLHELPKANIWEFLSLNPEGRIPTVRILCLFQNTEYISGRPSCLWQQGTPAAAEEMEEAIPHFSSNTPGQWWNSTGKVRNFILDPKVKWAWRVAWPPKETPERCQLGGNPTNPAVE